MPTVSVILPNHNYANFISDAINSIKAQTLSDIECIIVDDASTDDSVSVIKRLIKNDARFKLIELSQPVGVSAARNMALDMASGEYVSFLDSDDCYTEYALEMLVKLARESGSGTAGGDAEFVNGHFKWAPTNKPWNIRGWRMERDFTKLLLAPPKQKWIWIWRRVYKRSLIKDIRFPTEMKINGDDISFMLDLGWRLAGMPEVSIPVVHHRIHPLSITHTKQDFNRERVAVFPGLFRRVGETVIGRYKSDFLHALYNDLFTYMLRECLFKYRDLSDEDARFARKILRESCRVIPVKYLPFKKQLLCRYLRWGK